MIHLVEVSKSYYTDVGRRIILRRTSLSIPTDRNVGLLGRNGAGKSTLIRLISGVEPPTTGEVVRTSSVSWPLGFSGGVHGTMTGRQNCVFVARIMGLDPEEVFDSVARFSELGAYLDIEVSKYSSGMRARLNLGLSLAADFDCYLIDEGLSTGDRWFRDKALAAFEERRKRSGLLMVSHNARTVKQYCDMGIVLANGYLVPFEDLDQAVDFYTLGRLPSDV